MNFQKEIVNLQIKMQANLMSREGLIDRASKLSRDLTADEQSKFDALGIENDVLAGKVADLKKKQAATNDQPVVETIRMDNGDMGGGGYGRTVEIQLGTPPPEIWADVDGRQVLALSPQHKMVDYVRSAGLPEGFDPRRLSLGKAIRGRITGDWRGAEFEQKLMASGSTTDNVSGGWLIPNPLASMWIDLARANSVIMQAGAKTIPMESSDLRIARISADPTAEMKGENDTATDSGPSFDSILLVAKTLVCYATFSQEMIQDAPNSVQIIESVFAKALATEIDRQILTGTGSSEILGILNSTGINTTSVGTLSWDDLSTAIQYCEVDNHNPTSYILAPASKGALVRLKQGDGTNSPLTYQVPPEDVKQLKRFVTSSMGTTDGLVADMTKCLVGVRHDIRLQVSDTAGTTFAKNQLAIRAVARIDCVLEQPEAFCALTDI